VSENWAETPKVAGWHPTGRRTAHFSWVLLLLVPFPATRCQNLVAIEATRCILSKTGKPKWKSRLVR
jgi:hypothetical protein